MAARAPLPPASASPGRRATRVEKPLSSLRREPIANALCAKETRPQGHRQDGDGCRALRRTTVRAINARAATDIDCAKALVRFRRDHRESERNQVGERDSERPGQSIAPDAATTMCRAQCRTSR